MGLDISAFSKIKYRDDLKADENWNPVDVGAGRAAIGDFFVACVDSHFSDVADGIVHKGVYEYDNYRCFRAGSYGGYNLWRYALAQVVQHVDTDRDYESEAFFELINFSDCEGTIGAKTAAKLRDDFVNYHAAAKEYSKSFGVEESIYFMELYNSWMMAFELAAFDGCVVFH